MEDAFSTRMMNTVNDKFYSEFAHYFVCYRVRDEAQREVSFISHRLANRPKLPPDSLMFSQFPNGAKFHLTHEEAIETVRSQIANQRISEEQQWQVCSIGELNKALGFEPLTSMALLGGRWPEHPEIITNNMTP